MKKLKIILLCVPALFLIAGCVTEQRKWERTTAYLASHPDSAAKYCAHAFPPVDSVGKPVVHAANNVDYTGQIKDLGSQVATLQQRISSDSLKIANGGQISLQELLSYKDDVLEWQKKYNTLRALYKPCKPDTITIPHYITNTALVNTQATQIANLQKDLSKSEDRAKEAGDMATHRLWMLAGLAGVLGVAILLKIKSII